MNRKQRRANRTGGGFTRSTDAEALFQAAAVQHQQGRIAEAEAQYRRLLALHPAHSDGWHRLGVIALQTGKAQAAVTLIDRAIAGNGQVAAYHVHRGLALAQTGRPEEAAAACAKAVDLDPQSAEANVNLAIILLSLSRFEAAAEACRRAAALAPDLADAHSTLGLALQAMGRFEDAIVNQRRAIELAPDYAEAHAGLGAALLDLGWSDDALTQLQHAIALQPNSADAHNNLGRALIAAGRLEDAAASFRRSIRADATFLAAYSNLAGVLKTLGQIDEAAAHLRKAVSLAPDQAALLNNLALTLSAAGDVQGAMDAALRLLAVHDTPEAHRTFVHCVQQLRIDGAAEALRPLLNRALREAWGRPEDLARVTLDVVANSRDMAALLAGVANKAASSATSLLRRQDLAVLADDDLLQTLLCVTPNIDFELENVIALARRTLLQAATANEPLTSREISLHAALARQAFINEYIVRAAPDETRKAAQQHQQLSETLADGRRPAAEQVLAAASYAPLFSMPYSGRLLDFHWPEAIDHLLDVQIREPMEEARLRERIPQLTTLTPGSEAVRAQYEANPYPRWTRLAAASPPEALACHLRARYPLAPLAPLTRMGDGETLDILVAGCGTGRNALETHRAFAGARTLAIDLSLSSLAYAWRKTAEAGISGIDYAAADLLRIAECKREFDFIESIGVLHHLEDPFAGWRALLSVLRPGGVMRLGFYSALARRNLPRISAAQHSGDQLQDVRHALAARVDPEAREALRAQDFYSISAFRDLLLHTQEHRLSLGELGRFMEREGLNFIGFVIPDPVLAAYQRHFPHDPAGRDLAAWQAFEEANPDTFTRMYQFWVQRTSGQH